MSYMRPCQCCGQPTDNPESVCQDCRKDLNIQRTKQEIDIVICVDYGVDPTDFPKLCLSYGKDGYSFIYNEYQKPTILSQVELDDEDLETIYKSFNQEEENGTFETENYIISWIEEIY